MIQKFRRGDRVRIADDLGPEMAHFESGLEAIVMGSYADQYPEFDPHNTKSYSLLLIGPDCEVSWYYEDQLTFIRHDGEAEITAIRERRQALRQSRSDLQWIVDHWPEARKEGDSLQALANECGIGSLWGSSGEGIALYENSMALRTLFDEPMSQSIEAVRAMISTVRSRLAKK